MSAINGDKARFNRNRKAKIARRARNRTRLRDVEQQPTSKTPRSSKVSS